jgi:hypothetical protein
MAQLPDDDQLREMIRTLLQVQGVPMSAERVELVLPSYRNLLVQVQALEAVPLPVEIESAHIFDLSPGR